MLPVIFPTTLEETLSVPVEVPVSEMVRGIDMSKWNNLGTPNSPKTGDWTIPVKKGVKFAYIRAGSINTLTGECYRDYVVEEHSAGAEGVDIPYGHYWYFRANWSAKKQAEYFCEIIKDMKFTLPPCIDVEGSSNYGISKADYGRYILQFTDIVEQAFGMIPMIYTRQNFWDNNVISGNWKRYGLWVARYNYVITSPWSDGKYVYRDWPSWTFWQWSADGNGIAETYGFWKAGCDYAARDLELDRFNGNIETFNQYIAQLNSNKPQPTTQKEWITKCLYPWMKEKGYTGFVPPEE